MKKSSRPVKGSRMMPRSSSLDSLGVDNKKLEEDIAMMESSLQQHRSKMMQQDLAIRTQISKATGSSHWLSGAKGQLKGYRSHQDLQDKNGHHSRNVVSRKGQPKSGKYTTQRVKDKEKTEGKITSSSSGKEAYAKHGMDQNYGSILFYPSQQAQPDVHADEMHPVTRRRSSGSNHGILCNSSPEEKSTGHKKEGTVRRVSFDLSDEDDDDDDVDEMNKISTHTIKSKTDTLHRRYGMDLPMRKSDYPTEGTLDLNAEKITNLKAKVIAKASANIKPQSRKSKVKTKRGVQPKKPRHPEVNKMQDNKSQSVTKLPVHQIPPQLTAKGTELQRVLKVKSKPEKNLTDGSEPAHIYFKWEGYGSDSDEFDQKSSSHSSSDVFLLEPTVNYSKPDTTRKKKVISHDPAVTAWLYSLDLLDPEKYSQIFHTHEMTMETIPMLTENKLQDMGVINFGALKKIMNGIKELRSEGEKQHSYNFKMPAFSESGTRKTIHPETMDTSGDVEPVRGNKLSKMTPLNESGEICIAQANQSMYKDEISNSRGMKVNDLLVTGRRTDNQGMSNKSDGEVSKKKVQSLSAGVVNRTLASGVRAASHKLKSKQKHELQEQKRQEKLKRLKKAERDRMAQQHEQRIKERAERDKRKNAEGIEGCDEEETSDSVSPQASQTVCMELNDLQVYSQGLQRDKADRPSTKSWSGRGFDQSTDQEFESSNDFVTLSPNQKFQDLELQISGLQAVSSQDSTETEAKLERIQQQLASLQQRLRPQSMMHVPKSDEATTATQLEKKRVVSAPTGKSHGRTRTRSMSKQDLLKEVRKQKEKHRKEIKLLESELSRLRYRDPVKSCELTEEDIVFDETAVLGEGAFSQVFSGSFNGSEVAIKRLKIPIQEADHNYFAEEVSLLHELRHPRVVLLLGVCTTGKLPLMVLEYMAGGSLYHYLHDVNRSALDHVGYYQIARDICLGMNYLHRHRPVVLHLDLKSMNVLLGAYGRAKIADFGFSKLRHEAGTGKVRGTPAWMAPELLENAAELTPKVDVYSFAMILWEMLTKEIPYTGLSVFQILERVRHKKRPDIPASCPEPLRRLICACWEHKPNKRPSFKDILISLEGLSFPPEWKALLSAAGIPREAMEDTTSARNIISLVNQSMHMSQRQLNQMALQSHKELMKASQMEIAEEAAEDIDLHGNQADVRDMQGNAVDHMVSSASIPHGGMEDSGYDDDTVLLKHSTRGVTGQAGANPDGNQDMLKVEQPGRSNTTRHAIPQAPPLPPPITPPTTNPTHAELIVQAQALHKTSSKTKHPSTSHSPERGGAHLKLDANMLSNQRELLRATTEGPHPSQLADLGQASEARLFSIADILKKAMNTRRVALRDDLQSKEDLQPDSLWSMDSL